MHDGDHLGMKSQIVHSKQVTLFTPNPMSFIEDTGLTYWYDEGPQALPLFLRTRMLSISTTTENAMAA
jgi:hypothetical protein